MTVEAELYSLLNRRKFAVNKTYDMLVRPVLLGLVVPQLCGLLISPCLASGEVINKALGDLAPGRSVSLRFRVTLDPTATDSGKVCNQARVLGSNFAPTLSDDPDTPEAQDPTETPLSQIFLDPVCEVHSEITTPLVTDRFTFTVRTTLDDQPTAGLVHFSVISGPNQGIDGEGTSDENGEIQFSYDNVGARDGNDIVRAVTTIGGRSSTCETQVRWDPLPVVSSTTCLSPISNIDEEVAFVDTTVELEALTLDHNEQPVAGRVLELKVVEGPNQGIKAASSTDNNGVGRFSYAGTGGTGSDILEIFNEDETSSCRRIVRWIDRPKNTITVSAYFG